MDTSSYFLFSILLLAELLTSTSASHHQEEIRTLLENDDSSAFRERVSTDLGFSAPSYEELTKMFNEINSGKVPHTIAIFGYNLTENVNSTYSYTNDNVGKTNSLSYGLIKRKNNHDFFSSLHFNFIEGQSGDFNYKAGVSFYSHGEYTKSKSNLSWQGSTTGVFLNRAKNGRYVAYGNYTASSEGHAQATQNRFLDFTCNAHSFMNTELYTTKNVEHYHGTSTDNNYAMNFNIFSLTGGSNSTISVYGSNGEKSLATVNGTVTNSDKQAEMESTSSGFALYDAVDPLGDANLYGIFNIPYAGAGIFI